MSSSTSDIPDTLTGTLAPCCLICAARVLQSQSVTIIPWCGDLVKSSRGSRLTRRAWKGRLSARQSRLTSYGGADAVRAERMVCVWPPLR